MTRTIEGVYDGIVLRPDAPLQLKADTRVRIIVEVLADATESPLSFLDTAIALKLTGLPPDLSANIDHYLYRHEQSSETVE